MNSLHKYSLNVVDNREYISYSELSTWLACHRKHKLKYLDLVDLDSQTVHTEFGRALHDANQTYLETRNMPPASLVLNEFLRLLEENKIPEPDPKEFHNSIEPILEEIPKFMAEKFGNWRFISAEFQLLETINNENTSKKFKGFIDGVIESQKSARLKSAKPDEMEHYLIDWKGQRLSAPILTPTGWTTMGQLKLGDEVIGSDGLPIKVTGIFPLGKREVFRVHISDGTFVDCTEDHLWRVRQNGGNWMVKTTRKLIEQKTALFLPVLSNPVKYVVNTKPLLIEPYVLGLILGDGSLRDTVRFTTRDPQLSEEILRLMPNWKLGAVSDKDRTPTFGFKTAITDFRALGLVDCKSEKKFIPNCYLLASPEQRLALIQGLLDTDGWVQKGIAKYSTTSPFLANGMKTLVQSLGGIAHHSIRQKKRIPTELPEHIVTVRLPCNLPPFRLERKLNKWNKNPTRKLHRRISKIEFVGWDQMQCIKVDAKDSLYVTNDFTITHNTTSWGWDAKKKRDPNKILQLALYKKFWAAKLGIEDLSQIKCGFVLLKRTTKRDRCELVPVSVGPKVLEHATDTLDQMIAFVSQGLFPKNIGQNCDYCPYRRTIHCP